MYKCENCGGTGERPVIARKNDGSRCYICGNCKSGNVRISSGYSCGICGRVLYEKEHAFEAGELLICEGCITRVMV